MTEDNLTKNIQILGEWFLPNSDKKIAGIFTYKNGQSELELLHFFESLESSKYPITVKTIHGETESGKVTLTDVIFNHSSVHIGSVYIAIFGHHLEDTHIIRNMSFNFDLLNEWAISKYPYTEISFDKKSIQKMQNTPEKFSCKINDIECDLHISLGTGSTHLKGIETYHVSNFNLKTEKNKSVHDLIELVFGMQQFLMLVMGRNLNLDNMKTSIDNFSYDVYLSILRNEDKGSDLDHFFNISYMRENYTKILTNWFDFYLKNKYLLNLFFDTMKKEEIVDTDFYVFASILEGYYKSKHKEEGNYKKRISIILKSFESQFSNVDEFVKEVTCMRHSMFHFNRRKELDTDKLHHLIHDLFFILRILLLNDVGLNISIKSDLRIKKLIVLKEKTIQ